MALDKDAASPTIDRDPMYAAEAEPPAAPAKPEASTTPPAATEPAHRVIRLLLYVDREDAQPVVGL